MTPDCQHVALTSMDGRLRVIDHVAEKLWDTYTSYFGGLTCVCWSPDGKFILTGGQDDLCLGGHTAVSMGLFGVVATSTKDGP
ncbi:hypothetical protein HK405_004281 [Cladochytrium tenue]|nr:hypothetical protein HK405_004281 [Cladochytrium tenue]